MAKKRNSVKKAASPKPARKAPTHIVFKKPPQPVFVSLAITEGTYEIVITKKA